MVINILPINIHVYHCLRVYITNSKEMHCNNLLYSKKIIVHIFYSQKYEK